jgi:hypothetical protein
MRENSFFTEKYKYEVCGVEVQLHAFLDSALKRRERSASRHFRHILGEKPPISIE